MDMRKFGATGIKEPYHYKLYFNTNVLPEVELKP